MMRKLREGLVSSDSEKPEGPHSDPMKFGDAFYVSELSKLPRELGPPKTRPRSARYLGAVIWEWGPAHSRTDHLYLSMDRSRRFHLLWIEWRDEHANESRLAAYAPATAKSSELVGVRLVGAAYRGEEKEYRSNTGPWEETHGGILTTTILDNLAKRIWPSGGPRTTESESVDFHRSSAFDLALSEPLLEEFKRSGHVAQVFIDLLEAEGEGGLGHAGFIPEIDSSNFDPSMLEDAGIPEKRLENLYAGATPTASEVRKWIAAVRDRIHTSGEGPWKIAALHRVKAHDGATLYGVALQEDGGSWADVFGPFLTPSSALKYLKRAGEVFDVDWPAD